AFTEAVAVWKDVDVRVYAADPEDRFFQYLSPISGDPEAAPAELDARAVPEDAATLRIPRDEIERLGFGSFSEDVVVTRLPIVDGASWVIVFAGVIDADEEARLIVYANLLREALTTVAASAKTRLISAVTQLLLRLYEPIEVTAQLALGELNAALGGSESAL